MIQEYVWMVENIALGEGRSLRKARDIEGKGERKGEGKGYEGMKTHTNCFIGGAPLLLPW